MRGVAWTTNVILGLTVVLLWGCGKTQDNLTVGTKPQQTAAPISLPPRLLVAVTEKFPQYRVPASSDLTAYWAKTDQDGAIPFLCEGDFTGDGLTDYAIVLIGQETWRFVVFEQRTEGDFRSAYVARPLLPSESPKSAQAQEGVLFEAPQELILEKLPKGNVWAPEAGDEPYEVKLQTEGIILHHRKKLKLSPGDLDATTVISYANGRFKQDNCCELLVPIDLPDGAKRHQAPSPTGPSSQVTRSVDSAQTALLEKASEQQERALRRYHENAWLVHEAMQAGQWDEALSARIMKLVKAATPDWDHANPSHSEIRGPEIAVRLRPWLAMAQKLEPPKQAAALLIADRTVEMEEEDGNLEPQDTEKSATEEAPSGKRPKSTVQLELEKQGARFVYDDGSERYFYALNWLQQSYELDPKGRAGELAFVALMNKGFETSQNCANGSDQFREVIRRGTAFLRERHSTDVEARVHFAMADAYRDIVVLASDVQDESHAYADPNNYKPEASTARTKAIAEYRAGLALDRSEVSLMAKERLRSLRAGEASYDIRFYCQELE
jgi:hypothetical protein